MEQNHNALDMWCANKLVGGSPWACDYDSSDPRHKSAGITNVYASSSSGGSSCKKHSTYSACNKKKESHDNCYWDEDDNECREAKSCNDLQTEDHCLKANHKKATGCGWWNPNTDGTDPPTGYMCNKCEEMGREACREGKYKGCRWGYCSLDISETNKCLAANWISVNECGIIFPE